MTISLPPDKRRGNESKLFTTEVKNPLWHNNRQSTQKSIHIESQLEVSRAEASPTPTPSPIPLSSNSHIPEHHHCAMAWLSRHPKPGNDWLPSDLPPYNIIITDESFGRFFEIPVEQLPALPPSLRPFADTPDRNAAADDDTCRLLHYLDLAHSSKIGQEATIDAFAMWLLHKLDYHEGRRIILSSQVLPLFICATKSCARPDLSICDDNDIFLLVQRNQTMDSPDAVEPQLVAEAIAVFQRNNHTRVRELHLPVLDEMTIPAIALVGTSPTFYKIRITYELNHAIETGTYPALTTEVFRHIPRVPGRVRDGMIPVDNRDTILRHFMEFKKFI